MSFDKYVGTFIKGFIRLNPDKSPAESSGWQKLASYPSYAELRKEGCENIGAVLMNNCIVVDVDDRGQADVLLSAVKAKNVKTLACRTDRGEHFYFKQCFPSADIVTGVYLACGLKADTKTGDSDRGAYMAVMLNGKERQIDYDHSEDRSYEELPCWLYPLGAGDRDHDWRLYNMRKGERNETLKNYMFPLMRLFECDRERTTQTLEFIGEFIFHDRMHKREFSFLNDKSFAFVEKKVTEATFLTGKTFHHDVMGDLAINSLSIKRVEDALFSFDGATYTSSTRAITKFCTAKYRKINENQKRQVIGYIGDTLEGLDGLHPSSSHICFENCVYNYVTGETMAFTPDIVLFNRIPHKLNKSAYSRTFDKALDAWTMDDKSLRAVLEEYIGYNFVSHSKACKAFLFLGEENSGKSTFLKFMLRLLGDSNVSSNDLSEMGERFATATLMNKLANIADDISDDAITGKYQSVFKMVVDGDKLKGEYKGGAIFYGYPYCTLTFSANAVPYIQQVKKEIAKRLMIIEFANKFEGSAKDSSFHEKLHTEEAFEYAISIGLDGLQRLVANNWQFSHCDAIDKLTEKYLTKIDSVRAFVEDSLTIENIVNRETSSVYLDYRTYCNELGLTASSKSVLNKFLFEKFGLECGSRKDREGKSIYCFVMRKDYQKYQKKFEL